MTDLIPFLPSSPDRLTAPEFVSFMAEIWDKDPHNLYSQWHNAHHVLGAIQAKCRSRARTQTKWAWEVWVLPSGDLIRVHYDGGGLRAIHMRDINGGAS